MRLTPPHLTHRSSSRSLPGRIGFTVLLLLTALTGLAAPFGTDVTYQGRLTENGAPANSVNDFTFTLYDTATGGATVGLSNVVNDLAVTNGFFNVTLDFPGAFDGNARWLQIAVRPGASAGAYTNLVPRQPILATPYAIRALSAGTAGSATTARRDAAGAVTSSGLAPGSVGGAAIADGSITSADLSAGLLDTTFWKLGGNDVGATPGANIMGSTNNQPVEIRANNFRALRLEPRGSGLSPTLLGGYHQNIVNGSGSTIAGGGTSGAINQADGNYAFIGAGIGARAADSAVVGGGAYNSALGPFSMVGSGIANTNRGLYAALVAGTNNSVGPGADSAFVGGGAGNRALGLYSSVGGGSSNTASGTNSTISGGSLNVAAGQSSFAAGNRAKANHKGSFVWADSQNIDFTSSASDQFLIRAAGNVGINKTNPATTLDVNGTVTATGFSGNGAGLTGLNAANLAGPIPDERLSANVALRSGGNNLTGDQVISGGSLFFGDPGTPMIHMFSSGIANADRMVLSHSPAFPNWGLQYHDPTDQFNFIGDGNPVMTVRLGSHKVGIGTAQPSASLSVTADGARELIGSAKSETLLTSSGDLGTTAGDELALATFGFGSANNSSLGIRALRVTDGSSWPSTAIGLGMDVDNTVRAGASLWLNAYGNVGIGTSSPGAKLHVVGDAVVAGVVRASSDVAEGFEVSGAAAGYSLLDRVTGAAGRWSMFAGNGDLGFWNGGANRMTLTSAGHLTVSVLTILGGADITEPFKMSGKDLPKGAVVVIDETNPGHLRLSESAYDTRVAGIISGANGVNPGISLSQQGVMEGDQKVALSGRVYVQADAFNGAIKPGDLLTTSATPGHAMKVSDPSKAQGAILGKAMTALVEGKGLVLVLVTLQ